MNSLTHRTFREDFARLPIAIQRRTREAYAAFRKNPFQQTLHFKRLQTTEPLWSIRVTNSYRAVGYRKHDDEIIWVFIGSHAAYDRFIEKL